MKHILTFTTAFLLITNLMAQSPEKISYQAVIRDSNNELVSNTDVGMQISIILDSADGSAIYSETQKPTTNANGLVSIEIGGDAATVLLGNFSTIDWSSRTYFIKTETDPTGGTSYSITGTSQLLSVPYALHAKSAENISGEITYTETDPVFNDWDKTTGIQITENQISDLKTYLTSETDPLFNASVASGITQADTSKWNDKLESEIDGSITNEIQNLSQVLTENNDGGGAQIKNIADPTDNQDAATKAYIDDVVNRVMNTMSRSNESFTSDTTGTVTDKEGNSYNTIKIGNQWWMAENLRYLPSVVGPATGSNTTPYFYVNGYDGTDVNAAKATANYTTYGVLYNWSAAMNGEENSAANPSGVQGACPTGWHIPSEAEWIQLTDYLGGENNAGGKLKEIGTSHWNSPNTGANNESGFTALPSGRRYYQGYFPNIGTDGFWWSTTATVVSGSSKIRSLSYYYNEILINGTTHETGISIRCVRD